MRLKTLVLCSSSAAILAFAGTPALAQDDPATPGSDRRGADQSGRSDGSTDAADAATETPRARTRSSSPACAAASSRRRTSSAIREQIVDAIVAEDIGKLPDVAVSDTAARIPGIQVLRERGEAGSVLLRGLDRTFYTTTYNGREIFTAETRSVALQDFPAGGISAIEAFKTSTANLVEPGLVRPDQRPLAPAVRFQGLRDRRLGLGELSRTSRRTFSPTRSC